MIAMIRELKELGIPVALENVALTNFAFVSGVWKPETYLDLRVGSLAYDMLEVKRRTGCGLVVDLEHLSFSLNFILGTGNYSGLCEHSSSPKRLSGSEKKLKECCGFFLRPGWMPAVFNQTDLFGELAKIGGTVYHIAGFSPEFGTWQEIVSGKIASHASIRANDGALRKFLKMEMLINPELILVPEVAGSENPCWADRPPNAQETSFENLCEMVCQIMAGK